MAAECSDLHIHPTLELPRLSPLRLWRASLSAAGPHPGPSSSPNGLSGPLLALLGLSLVLQLARATFWPDLPLALRYERQAILHGEGWRLLTGQLVHLGWAHLALNALGLLLVATLLGRLWRPRAWWVLCGASALGVGLGLLWTSPQVSWYVGLSGLAHGIAAAGAVALWRDGAPAGRWWLLGLAAKLAKEHWLGAMPGSAAWLGGATIVAAHLDGALTGALLAALLPRSPKPLPLPPPPPLA